MGALPCLSSRHTHTTTERPRRMNALDPAHLAAAVALIEPLIIRTIAFDVSTFSRLKDFQRKLEGLMRRDTGNAEVLKYLIHTHPEVQALANGR